MMKKLWGIYILSWENPGRVSTGVTKMIFGEAGAIGAGKNAERYCLFHDPQKII